MNGTRNTTRPISRKTRIVEIIGPAGAGKTTLYLALGCYAESVQLENFPDVHRIADAPFFILNGIQLIPSLLRLSQPDSRQLTRREFAWMSMLHGWSALLRRQASHNDRVIILDQGPIYLLAEVRLFGPDYLKRKHAEGFWQHLYSCWSASLDMVLWLDAANEVLLDRIRNRQQEHSVKDESPAIVYEFLNSYRMEYEFILSMLLANKPGLKILKIDTGEQQTKQLVNQFFSEIGC